jgi:hypothetical protein
MLLGIITTYDTAIGKCFMDCFRPITAVCCNENLAPNCYYLWITLGWQQGTVRIPDFQALNIHRFNQHERFGMNRCGWQKPRLVRCFTFGHSGYDSWLSEGGTAVFVVVYMPAQTATQVHSTISSIKLAEEQFNACSGLSLLRPDMPRDSGQLSQDHGD